jgi:hypothetical protein
MQALVRLAGWGMAASVAMAVAVVIASSSGSQQRWNVVAAGLSRTATAKAVKAEPPGAAQLARLAATENEMRLLIEMVRSLNNDKERVLARLTAIEHNLDDVTGSIRRQAATPPPPPVAATPEPSQAAPQPQAAAPALPAPEQTVPPEAPALAAPPEPAAPAASTEPAVSVASAPVPADAAEPEPARERQPLVGVDVGGASSFDGLRALWKSLTASHAEEFEGMHPVVSARESSKSRAAELRLVVGPIEDDEAARHICARLITSKRHCHPAAFGGGSLALTAPEPPSRPKSVPRRRASPPNRPLFSDR